ncbi:MAG: hypothetical protein KC910_24840 [Candidatus Eremiobacteraeota bacterium]|nr:hypothetical protein [Candidatus Eremiobacteraeota bacterium]
MSDIQITPEVRKKDKVLEPGQLELLEAFALSQAAVEATALSRLRHA